MTIPSKSWSVIADGQVDADSPLDTTLITAIRDNLIHLEEWLGDGYTAAKDHNHDGVSSSLIAGGAIDTTVQSDGFQSISASGTWTPAAGVYQMARDAGFAGTPALGLYISGAWEGDIFAYIEGGVLFFDGTNMRFRNTSAVNTIKFWWQKF